MYTIAVDAMGGDNAPLDILKGVKRAQRENPDIRFILLGPQDILQSELTQLNISTSDKVVIENAQDVVSMSESPSISYKRKQNSSIRIGLNLVKDGKANAFVSAGNTGAVMLASTLILGRIKGVERPAISAVLPSQKNPFVMLDMGSNVDCKPSHLAQFSVMGYYFSKLLLGINEPRVGLLNIGEEPDKGNALTLATFSILEKLPFNFIGNIEGKELLLNKADVVVCDGFVGNTILKFGEGVYKLFMSFFKSEAKRSVFSLMGLLLMKSSLKLFKKQYDYDEYGGAPLLGLKGVSIIAHGSANEIAFSNAIKMAIQTVESDMVNQISNAIQSESSKFEITEAGEVDSKTIGSGGADN